MHCVDHKYDKSFRYVELSVPSHLVDAFGLILEILRVERVEERNQEAERSAYMPEEVRPTNAVYRCTIQHLLNCQLLHTILTAQPVDVQTACRKVFANSPQIRE